MLTAQFALLGRVRIPESEWKSDRDDAAGELTTVESAIAGIADNLLSGHTVPKRHALILEKPWLSGTKFKRPYGKSIDLSNRATLRPFASLLESLRISCHELILARRSRRIGSRSRNS